MHGLQTIETSFLRLAAQILPAFVDRQVFAVYGKPREAFIHVYRHVFGLVPLPHGHAAFSFEHGTETFSCFHAYISFTEACAH